MIQLGETIPVGLDCRGETELSRGVAQYLQDP